MAPPPCSGRATLLLVPTELEARLLAELGGLGRAPLALCGFGPLASAARTARLLAQLDPGRVLLVGAAGTWDTQRLPIGTARAFAQVAQDGVHARRHGFSQLGTARVQHEEREEQLELARPAGAAGLLLSVGAPLLAGAELDARRARHPAALAEDMEGFGVALAAALAGVPLAIVRGISNAVGQREGWDLRGALAAARELALEHLESSAGWECDA